MAVGLAAEHNIELYLYKADRSQFTDDDDDGPDAEDSINLDRAFRIINEVIRNLVGDDINLDIKTLRVRSPSTGNIKYIKYTLDFSEFRRGVDLITPLRIKERLLDYVNARLKGTGFTLGLSPPFDGGKRRVKSKRISKRKFQRNTKRTVNGGKRSSKRRRSSHRRRF